MSAPIEQLSDSSADEFLAELTEKAQMSPIWPWGLVLAATFGWLTLDPAKGYPLWLTILCLIVLAGILAGTAWVRLWDIARRSTVLFYELEGAAEDAYEKLVDGFSNIQSCERKWHIAAAGKVLDRRYHAGAGHLVNRASLDARVAPMRKINCNIDVPCLKTSKHEFYFCPDRIFVYSRNKIAAFGYNTLKFEVASTKFIEDGAVPKDAEVVGHTWRYVNKNGSPDRRFKNNQQLAVARYDELTMHTSTGVNESFQLSKPGSGEAFCKAVRSMSNFPPAEARTA